MCILFLNIIEVNIRHVGNLQDLRFSSSRISVKSMSISHQSIASWKTKPIRRSKAANNVLALLLKHQVLHVWAGRRRNPLLARHRRALSVLCGKQAAWCGKSRAACEAPRESAERVHRRSLRLLRQHADLPLVLLLHDDPDGRLSPGLGATYDMIYYRL